MAASFDNLETVATFTHDGRTYELDDLGAGEHPHQAGAFAVYLDGEQVAEFADLGGSGPAWPNGEDCDDPVILAAFAAIPR